MGEKILLENNNFGVLILVSVNILIAYINEQDKKQEKNFTVQNGGGSKEDFLAVLNEQMKKDGPPATPPVMKDYADRCYATDHEGNIDYDEWKLLMMTWIIQSVVINRIN